MERQGVTAQRIRLSISLGGPRQSLVVPGGWFLAACPVRGRVFDDGDMEWAFTGEVIEWRGPAPYLFVAMTPEDSEDLNEAARGLIYWGQVPVHVTIGGTRFTTALFPRGGRYLVPVKAAVQRAEAIGEGSVVDVVLRLDASRRK